MMYINVNDAQEWYEHITEVLAEHNYKYARVKPPKEEPHAIVTYAWDPCGVLLHFAQDKKVAGRAMVPQTSCCSARFSNGGQKIPAATLHTMPVLRRHPALSPQANQCVR